MNDQSAEASKTVKLIEEGKVKNLVELVPEGQSPKLFIDLIKTQVMGVDRQGKARPDEDLLLFLYVCKRTGLDPIVKQIYPVYRWDSRLGKDKMVIQTGIDGFRLVAQRTKQYAGSDNISYTPEDESTRFPIRATCTVYKMMNGQRVPFTATARWAEYVQKDKQGNPMQMWLNMPYGQLGKCAEALALRKGFPNELSGIYSQEEMEQSNNPTIDLPKPDAKITVVHGAPKTEQVSVPPVPAEPGKTPALGTPEAAKQPTPAETTLPAPSTPPAGTKAVVPDIAAMRKVLQDRVEKSREIAKQP